MAKRRDRLLCCTDHGLRFASAAEEETPAPSVWRYF